VNKVLVNALILAGADDDATKLGVPVKALIDIHGKPMIQYVIHALRTCGLVRKIAVVGPYHQLFPLLQNEVEYIIDDRLSIINNVLAGMEYFDKENDLLICTCDIPMITEESIRDFILKSQNLNADLCYPIVNKTFNQAKFPGIIRTYAALKEGTFTGGNLFYIKPHIIGRCCKKANEFIVYRKNVLKMAKVLGFKTLFLLCIKRLSLTYIEQRVSELFKIKARVVISEFPEIANDVDKPSDLDFVRKMLMDKKF